MSNQEAAASRSPARRPLAFALEAMGGALLAGPTDVDSRGFAGAATDNRQVRPGRLFFALRGERVDGYDFCSAASAAGAAALVVPTGRGVPAGVSGLPVIGVPDTRAALGELARAVRRIFPGKVVGITGSNGKTTTKELVAAALDVRATAGRPSGEVLRTAGNFNTDIGLPLTVLEATGEEQYWVLEMAMRGRGEIAYLADIAVPHVGLVTNVAGAHLGRLGSLAEVARAKGEIFSGLAPDGIAVLPADEPLLEAECRHLPERRKRRFGGAALAAPAGSPPADVRILDFVPAGPQGAVVRLAVGMLPVVARVPLAGEHNARNAAAALAVIQALELPAREAAAAMAHVALPAHRSHLVSVGGRMVMDDCYNANPASMAAALRAVRASAGTAGRAYAVVGDMLEIGRQSQELHAGIGRLAAELGFSGLVAVGPESVHLAEAARAAGIAGERVVATEEPTVAARKVAEWALPGDWILLKASRALRLERVLDELVALEGAGK